MKWGPYEKDYIDWRILPDSEYTSANELPLDLPDAVDYFFAFGPESTSELQDLSDYFFTCIFPDIVGEGFVC